MDWMNWKTWTTIGVILIAVFAIYAFAHGGDETTPAPAAPRTPATVQKARAAQTASTPGVPVLHMEWLDSQSGSYRIERNLFSFREPPPKPPEPAKVIKAPPPPPDQDKDGIPDFRDNCPTQYNPDQADENRNGKGDVCDPDYAEWKKNQPPPRIPPPQFTLKYIGTFGPANNPIATFNGNDGEIVNVRVGEIIDGKFILRSIGIESVEIGFVGFPADEKTRVPLAQ
jgi:hypothetical protein